MIRQERLYKANELIRVISRTGRKFFRYKDEVSRLELDTRGRVWFVDAYNGSRCYTHYTGKWRNFTNGGTLKDLIIALKDYIVKGTPVPAGHFGPWPDWCCDGDLWGYGDDMEKVSEAYRRLRLGEV